MMMQSILLFLTPLAHAIFTLADCSTHTGNLTECKLSGYCEVNGATCQLMTECYRANEVTACLAGKATFTIVAQTCTNINIDFKYDNVCVKTGETSVPNGLLRFRRQANITRSADITLSETPITVLMTTTTPQKYTYQLFTLDILLASATQLTDILNAFNQGINQLITDTIQPKFLEKAVLETFQNIRDDISYTRVSRNLQWVNAWKLVDILFQRYWVYKAYYTVNYNFINFGFSDLNRELITITGGNTAAGITYQIDISWTSYANNGYIYVAAFAPEQFGIVSAGQMSDLIYIKIVKDDGTAQDLTNVPLSIKYTWVNPILQTTVYQQTFDKLFTGTYAPAAGTAVASCVFPLTATTYCPSFTLPSAALDNFIIFHHAAISDCTAITGNQPYHRLACV